MNEVQVTKTKKRNIIFGTKTNGEVAVMGIVGGSGVTFLLLSFTLLGLILGLIMSIFVIIIHALAYVSLLRYDKQYEMPKYQAVWKKLKSKNKKKVYFYDYKVSNDGKINMPIMNKKVLEELKMMEGGYNE